MTGSWGRRGMRFPCLSSENPASSQDWSGWFLPCECLPASYSDALCWGGSEAAAHLLEGSGGELLTPRLLRLVMEGKGGMGRLKAEETSIGLIHGFYGDSWLRTSSWVSCPWRPQWLHLLVSLTTSLRYSSLYIQFTHLQLPIQWLLVYFESCNHCLN